MEKNLDVLAEAVRETQSKMNEQYLECYLHVQTTEYEDFQKATNEIYSNPCAFEPEIMLRGFLKNNNYGRIIPYSLEYTPLEHNTNLPSAGVIFSLNYLGTQNLNNIIQYVSTLNLPLGSKLTARANEPIVGHPIFNICSVITLEISPVYEDGGEQHFKDCGYSEIPKKQIEKFVDEMQVKDIYFCSSPFNGYADEYQRANYESYEDKCYNQNNATNDTTAA